MNLSRENLHRVCRLCLLDQGHMLSLYELPIRGQQSLPERIMTCADIQVKQNDGLPTRICIKCAVLLDSCVAFRQQCKDSDIKMKQLLSSAQQSLATPIKSELHDVAVLNMASVTATPPKMKRETMEVIYHRSRVSWIADTSPDSAPIIHSITVSDSEPHSADEDGGHQVAVESTGEDAVVRHSSVLEAKSNEEKPVVQIPSVLGSKPNDIDAVVQNSSDIGAKYKENDAVVQDSTAFGAKSNVEKTVVQLSSDLGAKYKENDAIIQISSSSEVDSGAEDDINKPPSSTVESQDDDVVIVSASSAEDQPKPVAIPFIHLERLDEAVIKMYAEKRKEHESKPKKKYHKIVIFSDTGSDEDDVIPVPVRKRGRPRTKPQVVPARIGRWSHTGSSRSSSIIDDVIESVVKSESPVRGSKSKGSHSGNSRASTIINDVIESVVGSTRAESMEIRQATSISVCESRKNYDDAPISDVEDVRKDTEEAAIPMVGDIRRDEGTGMNVGDVIKDEGTGINLGELRGETGMNVGDSRKEAEEANCGGRDFTLINQEVYDDIMKNKWEFDVAEYTRLEREKVMRRLEEEFQSEKRMSRSHDQDGEGLQDTFIESNPVSEVDNNLTPYSDEDGHDSVESNPVSEVDNNLTPYSDEDGHDSVESNLNDKTHPECRLESDQTLVDEQNVVEESPQSIPNELQEMKEEVQTCSLIPETISAEVTTPTPVSRTSDTPKKLYETGAKPPEVVAIIDEWTADIAKTSTENEKTHDEGETEIVNLVQTAKPVNKLSVSTESQGEEAEKSKDVPTVSPEQNLMKKECLQTNINKIQKEAKQVTPDSSNPSKKLNGLGKEIEKVMLQKAVKTQKSAEGSSEGKRIRHGTLTRLSNESIEIGSVMSLGDCETVVNMPYILDEYHFSDEYHVTDEPCPSIVQEHYEKRIDDWVTGTTIANPDIRDKYHSNSSFARGPRTASVCCGSDVVIVKEVGGGCARTMPVNMVYYATRHTRQMPEWTRTEREWFRSRIQEVELSRLRAVRFERRSLSLNHLKSQTVVSKNILVSKATSIVPRVSSPILAQNKSINSKPVPNGIVNVKGAVGTSKSTVVPNDIVGNCKRAVNNSVPPVVNIKGAVGTSKSTVVPNDIVGNCKRTVNNSVPPVPNNIVANAKRTFNNGHVKTPSGPNDKVDLKEKMATDKCKQVLQGIPAKNVSAVNEKVDLQKKVVVEKKQDALTEIPAKNVPAINGKVTSLVLKDTSTNMIVNTAKILPLSTANNQNDNQNAVTKHKEHALDPHQRRGDGGAKPDQNRQSVPPSNITNHIMNNNIVTPQEPMESHVTQFKPNNSIQDIPNKDINDNGKPVGTVNVPGIVAPQPSQQQEQTKRIGIRQKSADEVPVDTEPVERSPSKNLTMMFVSIESITNADSTVTDTQEIKTPQRQPQDIQTVVPDRTAEIRDVVEMLYEDEDDETLENIRKHIMSTQSFLSTPKKRVAVQQVGGESPAKISRLEEELRKTPQKLSENRRNVDERDCLRVIQSTAENTVVREKSNESPRKNPTTSKPSPDNPVPDAEMIRMARKQLEELDKPPARKQPEVTPLVSFILRGPMENQSAPKKVIDSKMAAAVKRFLNRGIPHSEYTEQLLLKRFAAPRDVGKSSEAKKPDAVDVADVAKRQKKIEDKQVKMCLNVEMPSKNGFYLETMSKQQPTCVFQNGFVGDVAKPAPVVRQYSLRRISEEAARIAESIKTFSESSCQTPWKPSLLPVLLESSHVEIVKNQNAVDERAARDLQKPALLKKIYEKAARSQSATVTCSDTEKQTQTAWLSEWRAPTVNKQMEDYVIPRKTTEPNNSAKRHVEDANKKQFRRKESWVFIAKKDNYDFTNPNNNRHDSVIKFTEGSKTSPDTTKRAKSLETIVQTLKKKKRKPVEPKERTIPCPICQKLFAMNCHLSKHMRAHSDERPYACHLCDWSFKTKQTLRTHVGCVHENLRYVCDECGMEFESKLRLQTHYRLVHLGERDNQCKICGKNYLRPKNLAAHMAKRHRT